MIKKLLVMAVLLMVAGNLMANPQIISQEIKRNGNVVITMTSDVPFQLVGTSDFINKVVLAEYKAKNHVIYIDKRRQANEPYFFYFVRPIAPKK